MKRPTFRPSVPPPESDTVEPFAEPSEFDDEPVPEELEELLELLPPPQAASASETVQAKTINARSVRLLPRDLNSTVLPFVTPGEPSAHRLGWQSVPLKLPQIWLKV